MKEKAYFLIDEGFTDASKEEQAEWARHKYGVKPRNADGLTEEQVGAVREMHTLLAIKGHSSYPALSMCKAIFPATFGEPPREPEYRFGRTGEWRAPRPDEWYEDSDGSPSLALGSTYSSAWILERYEVTDE